MRGFGGLFQSMAEVLARARGEVQHGMRSGGKRWRLSTKGQAAHNQRERRARRIAMAKASRRVNRRIL